MVVEGTRVRRTIESRQMQFSKESQFNNSQSYIRLGIDTTSQKVKCGAYLEKW